MPFIKTSVLAIDIGYRNFAYCHLVKTEKNTGEVDYTIAEWAKKDFGKKRNARSLKEAMIETLFKLDEDLDLEGISKIVIESQAASTALIKQIFEVVWTFFKVIREGKEYDYEIVIGNPKRKFTLFPDVTTPSKKEKLTYRERKKLSIEKAMHWLIQNGYGNSIDVFMNERKKDDYADCLLDAVYYIDE